MKRKLLLPGIACCLATSLLVSAVALADHDKARKGKASLDKSTDVSHYKIMKLSQAQGAMVKDRDGASVGTIQDLVANSDAGRIQFAILSLTGTDANGKYTAVPWRLLRQDSPTTFVLQADKEQLRTASTFTQDQWPDFSQRNVSNDIYVHYGLSYDRADVGGRVALPEGVERSTGVYIDDENRPAFPRPQPDGHSTFPFLHCEDKDK